MRNRRLKTQSYPYFMDLDVTGKSHPRTEFNARLQNLMNDNRDAFDLWWEWAEKPLDGPLTISAEIAFTT
jgi:hypothetical protein